MGMSESELIARGREALEQEDKDLREKAKIFKIEDIIPESNKAKTAYVKMGDGEYLKIQYGPLTGFDLLKLKEYKDDQERGYATIAIMLAKVDPSITLEKIKSMGAEVFNRIALVLANEMDFQKKLR